MSIMWITTFLQYFFFLMKNKELEFSRSGQNLLRIIPPYPSPKVHTKSNKSQPKLCGYCGEHVIPTKNETSHLNAKRELKYFFTGSRDVVKFWKSVAQPGQ